MSEQSPEQSMEGKISKNELKAKAQDESDPEVLRELYQNGGAFYWEVGNAMAFNEATPDDVLKDIFEKRTKCRWDFRGSEDDAVIQHLKDKFGEPNKVY